MGYDTLDLANHPQARRVRKKPIDVQVSFAREAGTLATPEGPVRYAAGAALLTGAAGDSWPVERAKFDIAYTPVQGVTAGADGLYHKRPAELLAMRLQTPMSVRVGLAGDPLQGQPGDWLVQYGDGDYGIVGAAIFAATYERLSPPAPATVGTCKGRYR